MKLKAMQFMVIMIYNLSYMPEHPLDCYQSLVISILDYYGFSALESLGSVWPWLFHISEVKSGVPVVHNKYLTNNERLLRLFGCSMTVRKIDSENIQSTLLEELSKNPFILNIDQYFVPHHYSHIFMQKHGEHTLLVKGVCDDQSQYYCLDVRPKYDGMIPADMLIHGIQYYNHMGGSRISTLNILHNVRLTHDEVFEMFVNEVKLVIHLIESRPITHDKNSLLDVVMIIKSYYEEMSFEEYLLTLRELCSLPWFWELERIYAWTLYYLNAEYPRKRLGIYHAQFILDLRSICSEAKSLFKKLYKSTLVRNKSYCDDVFAQLDYLCDMEYNVIKRLLHILSVRY